MTRREFAFSKNERLMDLPRHRLHCQVDNRTVGLCMLNVMPTGMRVPFEFILKTKSRTIRKILSRSNHPDIEKPITRKNDVRCKTSLTVIMRRDKRTNFSLPTKGNRTAQKESLTG